ncbi:MAG: sugar transferase [Desulfobacterales bacterium]|nr:MAG: sugar transferase [Desulfobacterales bacterium]
MYAKRISDIVVSSLLVVLSLPVLALVAVLIRLESPGPAIFRQKRVGMNRRRGNGYGVRGDHETIDRRNGNLGGRPFTMYKFRSMVKEAEAMLPCLVDLGALSEPVFKLDDDPRVTRVGKVLRKTSLDELPQLFNILKGDMTLVGPRPEAMNVVELYGEEHKRRLQVKPGLTGLQQISCRGTRSMQERLKYDIHYIRHRSLLFDLKILLKTVFVVLAGTGTH